MKKTKYYIEKESIDWDAFFLLFFFGWMVGLIYFISYSIPILNFWLVQRVERWDEIYNRKSYYKTKRISVRCEK